MDPNKLCRMRSEKELQAIIIFITITVIRGILFRLQLALKDVKKH